MRQKQWKIQQFRLGFEYLPREQRDDGERDRIATSGGGGRLLIGGRRKRKRDGVGREREPWGREGEERKRGGKKREFKSLGSLPLALFSIAIFFFFFFRNRNLKD